MYKLTLTRTRPNTNVGWYLNPVKLQSWVKTYFVRTNKLSQDDPFLRESEDGLTQTATWFSTSENFVNEFLDVFNDPTSHFKEKIEYELANGITKSHTVTEV